MCRCSIGGKRDGSHGGGEGRESRQRLRPEKVKEVVALVTECTPYVRSTKWFQVEP